MLLDAETGFVWVPVTHSEIEVLLTDSADNHLQQGLIDLIADYLETHATGRWTIALGGDTQRWSWMHDED